MARLKYLTINSFFCSTYPHIRASSDHCISMAQMPGFENAVCLTVRKPENRDTPRKQRTERHRAKDVS
jgi:hypothetical protein